MFYVIQSNSSVRLAAILAYLYQGGLLHRLGAYLEAGTPEDQWLLGDKYANADDAKDDKAVMRSVFEPFVVIVPAMVLEDWLNKTIAQKAGISTLFVTQFWGQYQWRLIGDVLEQESQYLHALGREDEALDVPETAMLSQSVMRWRLFAYLSHRETLKSIQHEGDEHVLAVLMLEGNGKIIEQARLWQLCDKLARLYVKYLTERSDWLDIWAKGGLLDVDGLIAQQQKFAQMMAGDDFLDDLSATIDASYTNNLHADSDKSAKMEFEGQMPEWLREYYHKLEAAFASLWRQLFAGSYLYRVQLEERFWQLLEDSNHAHHARIRQVLPKRLYLFTVQQLPQIELDFLQRLSVYCDVVLLHFNPSLMFWADIVDEKWLAKQKLLRSRLVYQKDAGHGLLSRLGKASRETLSMLVQMSGGEDFHSAHGQQQAVWVDAFDELIDAPNTLLTALKKDILFLEDEAVGNKLAKIFLNKDKLIFDDSLQIHNCHSLKRELEIARLKIAQWLNTPNADGSRRKLSDVVVFLPEVDSHHELIRSVFGEQVGIDGLYLPAKITGVANEAVDELWRAIFGLFYWVDGTRFYYADVCDWLMLPALHQSFDMDFAMADRACQLLKVAGFVRGFDENHLKNSLDDSDDDYRYSFAYALDRLVASLWLGDGLTDVFYIKSNNAQKTKTLPEVHSDDAAVIYALCRIYQALDEQVGRYQRYDEVLMQLDYIEYQVIERYFAYHKGSDSLRSVFGAINAMRASIRTNDVQYRRYDDKAYQTDEPIVMPLEFVLDALQKALLGQQISAEPSQFITFGRFGALRGVGFGLVLMLGMNLSAFPRTEPINRLDLSKAFLARRGDRVSEDDDNGAFLEAILQAWDACWIFYSGQSLTAASESLPASPVLELLDFLKNSLYKLTGDEKMPLLMADWLVQRHAALPFHDSVFVSRVIADKHYIATGDKKADDADNIDVSKAWLMDYQKQRIERLPPALLWQKVYANSHKHSLLPETITLPNDDDIKAMIERLNQGDELVRQVVLDNIARQIAKPATTYLAGKISLPNEQADMHDEPLGLDGLSLFYLNDRLLQAGYYQDGCGGHVSSKDDCDKSDGKLDISLLDVYYEPILPAGVARKISLQDSHKRLQELHQHLIMAIQTHFDGVLATLTASNQIARLTLHGQALQIYTRLPSQDTSFWGNIWAVKPRYQHIVKAFLYHLCWQAVRTPLDKPFDGVSVWQFFDDDPDAALVAFAAIEQMQAIDSLGKWLIFAQLLKQYPLVLTPQNAMSYLSAKAEGTEANFSNWLTRPFGYEPPDDNSHHASWRLILAEADAKEELDKVLPLADEVYKVLYDNLLLFNKK